jgi:hypothetical protein
MTRSFSELTKDLSPERRERIEQRKEQLRIENRPANPARRALAKINSSWSRRRAHSPLLLQHLVDEAVLDVDAP